MKRLAPLLAATLLVSASPAAGQTEVSVRGTTVRIQVPLDEDLLESVGPQARRFAAAAREAGVHGCLDLDVELAPSSDGHTARLIPQRLGQLVRTVASRGSPYRDSRTLLVGERTLRTPGSAREALVGLLRPGPTGELGQRALIHETFFSATSDLGPRPACRFRGTADVTARYDPFDLEVSSTFPFSVVIQPRGWVTGRMAPSTRRAVMVDDEAGECSTSSAPLRGGRISGTSDGRMLELTFHAVEQPTIELRCGDGSTFEVGGTYIGEFLEDMGTLEISAEDGSSRRVTTNPNVSEVYGTGTFTIRLRGQGR